jgi:hypothetical protein
VSAQLPPDVTCKYCVLQWKYHAGNSYGSAQSHKTINCLGCAERQEGIPAVYFLKQIEIFRLINLKFSRILELC